MKKLLLLVLLTIVTSASQLQAQEVFQSIVDNAKLVLDDPNADPFLKNVSTFKFKAMQYMCTTIIRLEGSADGKFLDQQAAAMNDFITHYFSDMAIHQSSNAEKQKAIMTRYWKASIDHPLFKDSNKNVTLEFIKTPGYITPFSLDTNWVEAVRSLGKK
ncbi:MAG: hypothetical protein HUK02_05220 [Bacteroidaceae bacterium]|nr:hypothetical protein [Bacteroidaceae bacterium]